MGQVLRGTHLESPHFPGGRSPGPAPATGGYHRLILSSLGSPTCVPLNAKKAGTEPQSLLLTQGCPATCLLGEQQRMPANERVTVAIFQEPCLPARSLETSGKADHPIWVSSAEPTCTKLWVQELGRGDEQDKTLLGFLLIHEAPGSGARCMLGVFCLPSSNCQYLDSSVYRLSTQTCAWWLRLPFLQEAFPDALRLLSCWSPWSCKGPTRSFIPIPISPGYSCLTPFSNP